MKEEANYLSPDLNNQKPKTNYKLFLVILAGAIIITIIIIGFFYLFLTIPEENNQDSYLNKTCAELNGTICKPELCEEDIMDSSDTQYQLNKCCLGTCSPEQGRTPCTTNLDCDDNNLCTVDVCGLAGISGCGYNEITTCKSFTDGCCPAGCNYSTDSDCEAPDDNIIIEDCSEESCPSGKECVQEKCLIRVEEGSYLVDEDDFESLGVNLMEYSFSQQTSEQYAIEVGYVFDGYYTFVGEIPDLKFVVYITKGPFNDGTISDDYKTQGTILSEDEYGDNSVRIEASTGGRIIGIDKGEWFISISYNSEDEAIANELVATILSKI